ncbi:fumarylacetoacetate hydrolase family protein [Olleya sp. YSTF-M6]|uniref:Fumarylacetoacetate hydrolase family protein n=1 Tax=Olleya sediminilitoris TaxID=2795739 RepID=A0ABS1WI43_9FLAO|nr:fumarylacetoacetate hydrolase family protein [Olleya sediminilitoris]MBL7558728.1 fumarylacetoacetate hydrolase family protein [Olleya sediminilitoris]
MKILAIGKNYIKDKSELEAIDKGFQMIFSKPESSLLTNNKDLVYPEFTSKLVYEAELVIKIGKTGKHINITDASDYISDIAIGIDYTAKDVLNQVREGKGPWELAKGFDGAAPISGFLPVSNFKDLNDINFSLTINNEEKQVGNTDFMIYNFAEIIAFTSQFMTLNPGDLIFTGTPAFGTGESVKGDHLQAYIEGELLLDFKVI